MSSLRKVFINFNLAAVLVLAVLVEPASAIQSHGYKGLYAHQLGHIFLVFAMVLFAVKIRRTRLAKERPWRLIAWGAWLFALWNIWAFTGHTLELYVPENAIAATPPAVVLLSLKELVYFVLKMDHLLSIPAVTCFYVGLKAMEKANNEDTRS